MGEVSEKNETKYFMELLEDKARAKTFSGVFSHVMKLLDDEITRVRQSLFKADEEVFELPEPEGPLVNLTEKVYVPVKEHPDFNFVGRIVGPGGLTIQQLGRSSGCQIMVRGRGSLRSAAREEQLRERAAFLHLNDDLHILVTAEDTENRARLKLARGVKAVRKFLTPADMDELKQSQMLQLSIINGTYRSKNNPLDLAAQPVSVSPPVQSPSPFLAYPPLSVFPPAQSPSPFLAYPPPAQSPSPFLAYPPPAQSPSPPLAYPPPAQSPSPPLAYPPLPVSLPVQSPPLAFPPLLQDSEMQCGTGQPLIYAPPLLSLPPERPPYDSLFSAYYAMGYWGALMSKREGEDQSANGTVAEKAGVALQ